MPSSAWTASSSVSTRTRRRPWGTAPTASAQLSAGVRKTVALVSRSDQLLLDAADRADLAVSVDLPGSGDELAAGELIGRQLVVDAECEHEPGARPADVLDLDLDGERERVRDHRGDSDCGHAFLVWGGTGDHGHLELGAITRDDEGDRVPGLLAANGVAHRIG